jgi:hypothetical protein
VKNYFGVLTMREALEARAYIIQDKPQDLAFDIVAERNGMAEFFLVEEDGENVWNSRDDYEPSTVTFKAITEVKEESFWYVVVCRATKSFIIAHSSGIYKDEYLDGDAYTLPVDKCFIINYKEFTNVNS